MTINAIFAMDINGGIGKGNDLPWPRNPEDMKWFQRQTTGDIVVMGRKTWESLGSKPLPNRINIVLTNSPIEGAPAGVYYGNILKVLQTIQSDFPNKTIWIIGGANIYVQALPYCDMIYMTKFKNAYDCDTFIPRESLLAFQKLVDYENKSDEVSFSVWSKI